MKGGFQLMQILGLLGIYFDAAVVFVTFIQIGSGHTVPALESQIYNIRHQKIFKSKLLGKFFLKAMY